MLRTLLQWLGPHRQGRWILNDLKENVEVLTDRHGVPHVYAGNLQDLYYVQGYLHARQRAFQMDLQRRIGQGRLAEILGAVALPADRFLRKLGLWPSAQRMWAELPVPVQRILIRYAQGVNAGFRRLKPLECWLLNYKIEPWTGLHTLLWTQVMAFDMGSNWEAEWVRARIFQKLGPQAARFFYLDNPPDLSTATGAPVGALEGLEEEFRAAREAIDQVAAWGGGSNAWAVSPRLSKSGEALLAADPHVLAKVPSTWFEVALESPEVSLYGVSLPGVPGIVIGHNDKVSWGITNSYVDTQDLVWEHLRDGQVQRPEGWEPLRARKESILVKGQGVVEETVWESSAGPLLFQNGEVGLALRWAGYAGGDTTLQGWFDLLASSSVESAQEALSRWCSPVLNFVLADTRGNIGYQLAGRVPRREGQRGLVPLAGWKDPVAWLGWIPPEEMPRSLNPECGYVVSCNNAPQPFSELPFLGVDFCDGYRAGRIIEVLQQGGHDLASFAALQADTVSLAAREMLELLRLEEVGHWPQAELARELQAWDGDLAATSRPAALQQVWMLEILREAYGQELGEDLLLHWLGAPVSPLGVLGGQAGRYVSFLLRQWRARRGPEWSAILLRSWEKALQKLSQRLGDKVQDWRWGRLHTFQPKHPLGVVPRLAGLVNAPPHEFGGDVSTVCQTTVLPQDPYAPRGWVPSFRLAARLSTPIESASILPTGNAGWVGDPGNFDQLPLFVKGQLHPSLSERGALERTRPARLVLLAGFRA
jgi:penicillin amidase